MKTDLAAELLLSSDDDDDGDNAVDDNNLLSTEQTGNTYPLQSVSGRYL